MDFKYFVYFLVGILMSNPSTCCASMLGGIYKGPNRWVVELIEDKASEYKFAYGDIVEKSKNYSNSELSVCLNFNFIDILIPKELSLNEKAECWGSIVTVDKYFSNVKFGNARFKNVYKLTVIRSGQVDVEGGAKKLPGGQRTFEILYSKNDGLIGFRELPSSREDFFLIDWRSLEMRSSP